MDQTAITYPFSTLENEGDMVKTILEDVDNLFNADPIIQQGGDMVRVGWDYTIDPGAAPGDCISEMTLHGKRLSAEKDLQVAGGTVASE